ncbi:MAG TPA: DUF6268 family outer membrane beta-barrel protein [Candidatus Udaeobacter sp.]|nr:DUF6268 family outer membrane beta-barrel protein [Candidatus Udaeobacter sp.]
MKRFGSPISVAICAASLLLAKPSFAEESTDNPLQSLGHISGEYTLEDTYVGAGDVQRGPNKKVSDFEENDSILNLVFTPRIQPGVLRIGVNWERFSFGLPEGAALPDTLQSVGLVVGLDTQFSDSIIVRAEGQPGVYDTEFDNLSWNSFNFPFLIGGTYIYSPSLQFIVGVSVDVERKYPVIPAAGIRWKIASQWLLDAVMPTPRLEYEVTKDVSLYVGANLKQASYRVPNDFGNSNGIPKLNHAILTYSEVRTGAGVDWKISPIITATGEVGYQPYRNFDFYRADVRYHQDGGAPYGMISLHGAF